MLCYVTIYIIIDFFFKKNIKNNYDIFIFLFIFVSCFFSVIYTASNISFLDNSFESFLWSLVYTLNNSKLSLNFQLFLALYLWCSNILNNTFKKYSFTVIVLICVYTFLVEEGVIKNYHINEFFLKNINISLANGMLLIHPLLIYTTYSYFFVSIYYIIYYFNLKFKNSFYKKIITLRFLYKNIFYSSFALLLGSLWAQQETNWGGWWNWDIIEFSAFIVYLYSLYLIHLYKTSYVQFIHSHADWVLLYIVLFIFSRKNIILSVHSFVISASIYDYREFFFLVLVMSKIKFVKSWFSFFKKSFYENISSLVSLVYYVNIFVLYYFAVVSLSLNKSYYEGSEIQKYFWLLFLSYYVFMNFKSRLLITNKIMYTFNVNYATYILTNLLKLFLFLNKKTSQIYWNIKVAHIIFFIFTALLYVSSKFEFFFLQNPNFKYKNILYKYVYSSNVGHSFLNENNENYFLMKKNNFIFSKSDIYGYSYIQNIRSFFFFNINIVFLKKKLYIIQICLQLILVLYCIINILNSLKYKYFRYLI